MLEGLDAVDFAHLEDAYGPAAGTPGMLRAAAGAREAADQAIDDLAAGIFHQGSYFSSSAPAARFLVEIAEHDVPSRASILLLLAAMSAGHPRRAVELLQRASSLHTDELTVLYHLSRALKAAGNEAESRKVLQKYTQLRQNARIEAEEVIILH